MHLTFLMLYKLNSFPYPSLSLLCEEKKQVTAVGLKGTVLNRIISVNKFKFKKKFQQFL